MSDCFHCAGKEGRKEGSRDCTVSKLLRLEAMYGDVTRACRSLCDDETGDKRHKWIKDFDGTVQGYGAGSRWVAMGGLVLQLVAM